MLDRTARRFPPITVGADMKNLRTDPRYQGLAVMTRLSKAILISAAFLTSALGVNAEPANSALLEDARSFMKSYAADLQTGNRDAVTNRYDARGAYFVGQGKKKFMTVEQIRKTYQGSWKPPTSFAWSDLSYEIVGNDAVVVVGGFDWGISDKKTVHVSYSALLIRADGNLRIRLEDESWQCDC